MGQRVSSRWKIMVWVLLVGPLHASSQTKDTTVVKVIADSVKAQVKAPIKQVPVTLHSLIIPGVLFAYGAVTLNVKPLQKLNTEVKEAIWDKHPHKQVFIENFTLLIPAATVYALNIAGIKGQNNLIDRSVIYGMSNLVANGIVFGVKAIGAETRPDSSDHYSFPSGHTAEAFVSAEFMRQEYKGVSPWYGFAGYAMAVGTGYMRMYNNKHWLSDVVAGAGVGIVSTRFSYWFYPIVKHVLFGSRKIKSTTMMLPTYNNGAYGLALVHQF
jgi:membrane-associated phospholipid phosphatase